jgi:hypothetical protein
MLAFLIGNLATILVSLVLLAVVVLIVWNLLRKKKAGSSVGCGCGCSGCHSAAACHKDQNPYT